MSLIHPDEVRKLDFIHLAFPLKLKSKWSTKNVPHAEFRHPEVCAICGERNILKHYKMRDKDNFSQGFIKVGICRGHMYPKNVESINKNPKNLSIFKIILIFCVLVWILMMFSFILSPVFLIILGFIIPGYIIFSILLYYTYKIENEKKKIKQFITCQYFLNLGFSYRTNPGDCVVSVKNPRWADEFQRLNIYAEVFPNLDYFHELFSEMKDFLKILGWALLGLIISILPVALLNIWLQFIKDIVLFYLYLGIISGILIFIIIYYSYMRFRLKKIRIGGYFGEGIRYDY